MAHIQLDVGTAEFLDRFIKTVSVTDLLIGIGKAPVFAAIIVTVGCFQGFKPREEPTASDGRPRAASSTPSLW